MLLSIIIVNFKTPAILALCVNSIKKTLGNLNCEIIAVDVSPRDDDAEMIKEKFPDIKTVLIKNNAGYSCSVNAGIKKTDSSSEYLLILNADIVVVKNAIGELIDFMDKNPAIGMAGPQLLNFNNTIQYSCFLFYTPAIVLYRRLPLGKIAYVRKVLDSFLMKECDHKTDRDVNWLMGSAMMVRRKALEKVGLMDERFFMYFEDVDWCRRFWENNWRITYHPAAKMAHYHGKQSSGFGKYTIIHIVSAIKYFKKHMGKKLPINKN